MTNAARLGLTLASLLLAASAQAEPAPAPEAQAPPAARRYPPPPPRISAPPPFEFPFEPSHPGGELSHADVAHADGYRAVSLSFGVGPGALFGPGENSLAIAYQLFRIGVGLDSGLAVVLGYERVGTTSVSPATETQSWLEQSVWSVGLQKHLTERLYARGTFGTGSVYEKVGRATFEGGRGITVGGAVGYEVLQLRHMTLAVDLHGTYTHYASESWKTAGLQAALSFF